MSRMATPLDVMRNLAYAAITAEPEFLLASEGNPGPGESTVISARLLGFDDQVDADWLMTDYRTELLRPIAPGRRSLMVWDVPPSPAMPVARYRPINWRADVSIDALHAVGTELERHIDPATNQVRIRFLLYRRTRNA